VRASLAYVPTATGAVHVRTAGTRRAGEPPVVLLHHTPSSGAAMVPVAAALAPRWSVSPDLPGFGASDPLPTPSVAGWSAAIADALGRLEIRDAVVFGHHAGAAVAARLAVAFPLLVGRLVLSAPPLLDDATRAALERRVPPPTEPRLDGRHVSAAWRRVLAKDPEIDLAVAHRETVSALAAGAAYLDAYRAVLAHDLAADLQALRVPTIVTTGPDDLLASAARRATALARARFHPLAAGGLHVCSTAPARLAALLLSDPHALDEDP
jgi:pimeloyl-ACP methyl ester carboxylesterase